MSLYLGRHPFVRPSTLNPSNIIKSVRAYVIDNKELEEKAGGGADCHAQGKGHWIVDTPISTPMSVYEVYKSSRKHWGINAIGTMIVEIELFDDGKDDDKPVGKGWYINWWRTRLLYR